MKTVGIRELKNRLSEYLREVRAGESVLITDRGDVVAELSAPGQARPDSSIPVGLLALARRGLATLGYSNDARLYVRLARKRRGKITAAELLDDERGAH